MDERKVVLITGGAMGQGRAHAYKYAENGFDVVLADMQEPTTDAFKETIAHCESYTWELTDEQVEKVININLIGTWRTDKYAAQYMLKQGFGRIINISSTSGLYGTPKLATYCMSKWGILGLTKTLAKEVGSKGIIVNALCPTKVKTPMCETMEYVQFINDLTGKEFKSVEEMYNGVPFLDVEDISSMVYWLGTSREAGKFNGREVALDLGTLQ